MLMKTSVDAYFIIVIGTPPCESLPLEASVTLYNKARMSENRRLHRVKGSPSHLLLSSDLFLLGR